VTGPSPLRTTSARALPFGAPNGSARA